MGQNLKNFVQILCSGTEVIWETLVPDHKLRMSASDNDIPDLHSESEDSDANGEQLELFVRNTVYTILKEEGLIDRQKTRESTPPVLRGEIGHRRVPHQATTAESTQRLESILRESKDIPDGHRDESAVPTGKKIGVWHPGRSNIALSAPPSARPSRRSVLRGERMAGTLLRPETTVLATSGRTQEATPMETEVHPASQSSTSTHADANRLDRVG